MTAKFSRQLGLAIRDRRTLAIRYYSASGDEESEREVDPYHLANVDGDFYLIAFCHRRGEVRTFAPSRIHALAPTGAIFPRAEGFDIASYLAGSFVVLRGAEGEQHHVRLLFNGEAVRYVRERSWHPTQRMSESSKGGLILELDVSHLREVERFALS